MASELTKDELIQKRVELENQVNEKQQEIADRKYSVDFENISNITAVIKQIDKSYRWTIKNATLVINLYDTLKNTKVSIQRSEDTNFTIELTAIEY